MQDLSLHILDIAENSVAARATRVEISIKEDSAADLLSLCIRDDGGGMDEEILKTVDDPFYTTKTVRKVGLGIPLLKQSAQECGGEFSIRSEKGSGTELCASFSLGHIDRKPMGDLAATLVVLIAGSPQIDFVLEYSKDGEYYRFDTSELRETLQEVPLNTPAVLSAIKDELEESLEAIM